MFVSSYNTYINTTATDKSAKERLEKPNTASSSSFKLEDSNVTSSLGLKSSNLPIDYVSTNLLLKNKQELESQKQQLQNPTDENIKKTKDTLNKFSGQNVLQNATSAYKSNSQMFSLLKIPQVSLDQTPKINKELPKNIQDIKESNLRTTMVNTYLQNDSYYKITA